MVLSHIASSRERLLDSHTYLCRTICVTHSSISFQQFSASIYTFFRIDNISTMCSGVVRKNIKNRKLKQIGHHCSRYFRGVPSEFPCSWAESGSQTGSRRQDCEVSGTWKDTHLFPTYHRDSGIMEPASHLTGARNWETHHCHHRGLQRNQVPVSEAVRGSAEEKCCLILRHFPARLVSRCSHVHLSLISKPAALC